MKKVLDYLKKNNVFLKGEKVAVAVSGGADSVALLYFLSKNSNLLGIELVCLNIDHSLRGNDSEKDSAFVKEFAESLGIECVSRKVDVKAFASVQKLTIEHAARVLRYETLFELASKAGAKKICLAHHKDDQAETVLMHMFRGSGLKGATGMSFITSDRLVRPFLYVSRREIEKYIEKNKLVFVTDESNTDTKFNRNYVRHVIVENIKKVYPAVVDNLSEFAEVCRADDDFIYSKLPKNIIKQKGKGVLILQKAEGLHSALFSRLVRNAFLKLNALVDIEQKHIKLIKGLFSLQVGKSIDLPNNLVAKKDYDGVIIAKASKPKPMLEEVFGFKKYKVDGWGEFRLTKHSGKVDFGNNVWFVDADKLPSDSVIRFRKVGDQFAKFGGGQKSLSNYFIDQKIPGKEREVTPLLACKNNIFVVVGSEISERVKIDKNTKNIIKIEVLSRTK